MSENDYSALNKDELVSLAEDRGLPKSGNKDELVARLELDDAEREIDGGDEPGDVDDSADEAGGEGDAPDESSDAMASPADLTEGETDEPLVEGEPEEGLELDPTASTLTTVSPADLREQGDEDEDDEDEDEDVAASATVPEIGAMASPADLRRRSPNIGVDDDVARRYQESLEPVSAPASYSNLPATHHAGNLDEATRYRQLPDGTRVPIEVQDVPDDEEEES